MNDKKPWRVLPGVPIDQLEDELNKIANDGYQVYRMDRYKHDISSEGVTCSAVVYDLVIFDAALVAQGSMTNMAEMLKGLNLDMKPSKGWPEPGPGG